MKDYIYNCDLEIPSERKSIKLIEPMIYDLKSKIKISDQKFYNLLIAFTEAVNNAIVHGNRCEQSKIVRINITATVHDIVLSVEDQGKGFDPDSVADPRAPENLLKESGRGVFLMRQLADSVDFFVTSKGTRIIMRFLI